jgi:hypothetical protein
MSIRRRKKLRELDHQLTQARSEHERLVREGREREPMLRRLEQHFRDNHFVELLVASLEQSRRRRT